MKRKTRQHSTRIVMIPIDEIKLIKNPYVHPERQIEELMKAIEVYGVTNPVGVSRHDKTLLLGYARYEAHKRLGRREIPARLLDFDPEEYYAVMISDNRISEFSSQNITEMIRIIEEELGRADPDSLIIAYTEDELASLKSWQDEQEQMSIDIDSIIDKPQSAPVRDAEEVVEIAVRVPLSVWEDDATRNLVNVSLADLKNKVSDVRVMAPKIIKPRRR